MWRTASLTCGRAQYAGSLCHLCTRKRTYKSVTISFPPFLSLYLTFPPPSSCYFCASAATDGRGCWMRLCTACAHTSPLAACHCLSGMPDATLMMVMTSPHLTATRLPQTHDADRQTTCSLCGDRIEPGEGASHAATCMFRRLPCQWCKTMVSHIELHTHEMTCGSESAVCGLCDRTVMKRLMPRHVPSFLSFFSLVLSVILTHAWAVLLVYILHRSTILDLVCMDLSTF